MVSISKIAKLKWDKMYSGGVAYLQIPGKINMVTKIGVGFSIKG